MKSLLTVAIILFNCLVVLKGYAQTTIILQPGAIDGKDAVVWSNGPTNTFGDHQSITAYGWTNGGIPGKKRILLSFDLSPIPSNATIVSAKLSLYYNPNDDIESFDVHTGDNAAIIRRITSPWDEQTVNWDSKPNTTNLNTAGIPKSTSGTQDYPNIKVTKLVQDMIDNPSTSFGFMIRMKRESPYRSILLASSDHLDAAKHPKLVITYTTDDQQKTMEATSADLKVYPNPVADILKLETTAIYNETAHIQIVNQLGEVVFTATMEPEELNAIPLANLPSGIYYLTLQNTKQKQTVQFIKQ